MIYDGVCLKYFLKFNNNNSISFVGIQFIVLKLKTLTQILELRVAGTWSYHAYGIGRRNKTENTIYRSYRSIHILSYGAIAQYDVDVTLRKEINGILFSFCSSSDRFRLICIVQLVVVSMQYV